MCGLYGIWNRDGRPLDLHAVERATTMLRHRGPDDEGYLLVDTRSGRHILCGGRDTTAALHLPRIGRFAGEPFDLAFGFRRLAILDLSPGGHQPMSDPSARRWIVFNGEIYNYVELRSELASLGHAFRSESDTEVILAAYAQWGRGCVERLRGMFAFALWDTSERRLWLARDRFGIKPLFTARDGDSFAFASEVKALLQGGAAFHPSARAAAAYVALGRIPSAAGGPTFFEGIEAAPAAHTLTVDRGNIRSDRYWRLPEADPSALGPRPSVRDRESAVRERYAELFTDTLRIHLRADVPIGTCLSGGLDSSSIVAMAGRLMREEHPAALERLGAHQQTFSAVYDDDGSWNERKHIDRVVAATGAAPNFVVPTAEGLLGDLDAMVWHQDEPVASTSIFAQWCVMRLARERGVTVLLDGQGADEVLGGYHTVYGTWLRDLVRKGRLAAALREARAAHAVAGLPGERLLANELARMIPGMERLLRGRRHTSFERRVAASGLSSAAAHLLHDEWRGGAMADMEHDHRTTAGYLEHAVTRDPLPNLLRYEDRNSMAFSIEGRVPFLDHILVEFVFRHGAHLRVRDGWTKWLQRVTIDALLPAEITWRRDKIGFGTPQAMWMRDLRPLLDSALRDSPEAKELADARAVAAVDDPGLIWRWICCAKWSRVFRDRTAALPAPAHTADVREVS